MILHSPEKSQAKKKKSNPLIGIGLLLVAIVLTILTCPIGFVYGLLHSLFTRFLGGLGEYCLQIAISIDQLGNVIMQHLLNVLFIKKDGYQFGNRDETISSVIGKNQEKNTLSGFGKFINAILNFIDKNHSLNSIDYHIEPDE